MKKYMFALVLCVSGMLLHADAVSIGRTRNGYPLIVPQVKKLAPADGVFTFPAKFTVAAPGSFDLAPFARIYKSAVKGSEFVRVKEGGKAFCRFELVKSGVPESAEGYALDITPKGMTVRARDVRGLFYGMQTVGWMLRNRDSISSLKCCAVTDWPDLEIRGLYLQLPPVVPGRLDRVCHVIDVLASLKYNTLLVGFFDNFPYADNPFTKRKTTFSKADIAKLMAAAKRNHIEIIPKLQVISHAGWMLNHRDWPKFYEGPAKKTQTTLYCPLHPEVLPVVMKMVREQAELLKPRYFHLGLDEILLGNYPMCPKCRAADPTEAVANHVRPIKDMLKKMNIQTIIYHDDYFGSNSPVVDKGVSIAQVPEKLGKDIMINSWEYTPTPTRIIGDKIRARGFKDLVYMSFAIDADNCWKLPKIAHQVGAKGNILAYWSIVPPTLDRHDNSAHEFYPSTIAQANYTWNAGDVEFSRIPIDSANILRELLDGAPKYRFRGRPSPVAIRGVCNTTIGDDPLFPRFDAALLAQIKRIAADDPARFELAEADGKLLAVALSGTPDDGRSTAPVTIRIGSVASGASFLVSASAFNGYGLSDKRQAIPIGDLKIVYNDGKSVDQPLVLCRNVNDWNTYIGGNAGRAVVRGNDTEGALFGFYAVDWRNPRPKQTIKEIVFSTRQAATTAPVLLALSLSDADGAPIGESDTPPQAVRSKRPEPKLVTIADFSGGMPRSWSKLFTGVPKGKVRIVDDPERGKVMEIAIPATSKRLARAAVDLPLNNPREFKNITFDIKVSDYSSIIRPDFYVMNRRATNVLGVLGYAAALGDKWQTVCIPRERFIPKEGGGIDPAKADRIRIGFFLKEDIRPTTIRIGRISFSDRALPGRSVDKSPAK